MEVSTRSVFVGNIAYDANEEQLMELFREVGPVVNFRLRFDKDTGKPLGFGYCEFANLTTALSAIRNLNGREFQGRTLRVDGTNSLVLKWLESVGSKYMPDPDASFREFVIASLQEQVEKGEKRPLETDIGAASAAEEPIAKKQRTDTPERFTYIVTELGEEHDATLTHIITGDLDGLEEFEALLLEGKKLDNETQDPITASVLGTMERPTWLKSYKKGRPLWEKMHALYVKHNMTNACHEPFKAEVQGCFRNVNYFIVSGD